ncbi:ABC transporter permease [Tranquillimonas rosea]|uniref:ABC transporter permease n=1 Tax=Tranquillimonas rosea TaxID=641238 RepID=UPI003BA8B150
MDNRALDPQLAFLVAINVVIVLAALGTTGADFVSLYNIQSMAAQVPELGLLALGVALAMISGRGGIDLSGIALANLAGIVGFKVAGAAFDPSQAALAYVLLFSAVALVTGVVGGALNGALVGYAGLTPIIATLGTQLLFTGVAVGITGGSAQNLGYIPIFDSFGNMPLFGIPPTFTLFLLIAAVLAALLKFSKFGIHLFLMGSNAKAAYFAGIPVRSMLFRTYLLAGVLASAAGIVIAARTSSVKWDYGTSYVLIAILLAVMAGVRPQGGYGRVVCVVLSTTALQMLSSLFNFVGLSNFFRDFAWGALLLLFLAFSRVDFSSYGLIQRQRA